MSKDPLIEKEKLATQKVLDVVNHILTTAQPDEFDPDELVNITQGTFNQLCNAYGDYTETVLAIVMSKGREESQMELNFL